MIDKAHRNDEGAALILAMIVMVVCSLIVASLLTFADARVTGTVLLADEAADAATADGATKAAVTSLQNGTFANAPGSVCFGSGATAAETLVLPNFNGTDSAAVRCLPVAGTGAQSSPVLIGPSNKPGNAILALGSGAADGVYVRNSYWSPLQGTFEVKGSIFSNGPISSVGGRIKVVPPAGEEATASQLYAIARGNCTGTIEAPTRNCNYTAADPRGNDPGYALPALPAPVALPTCQTVSGVRTATFSPGYYDNAAALNALTDGGCTVYRFLPGTYYFDFRNGDHSTAVMPAAAHEWRIEPCPLFGCGSGSPRMVAGKQANPAAPGSDCIDPTDAGNDGVRFIFGGNSRMVVEGIDAMICGKYSASSVPVAIQGVAAGAEAQAGLTATLTGTSGTGFTNPANAKDDDGAEATWVDTSGSTSARTRTFAGTGYAVAAPSRSVLDSVSLYVKHRNSAGATNDSRKVTISTASPAATCDVALASPSGSAVQTANLDLRARGCSSVVDALAQQIYSGGTTSATLTYSATVRHRGTEAVDAMQLRLTYRAPAYRAQASAVAGDSCNLAAPFRPGYAGSATGCAGLTIASSFATDVTVRGTTYLPTSAINMNLDLLNTGIPIGLFGKGSFGVGIISRAFYVNVAILGNQSLSALPANSYGRLDPAVVLETYLCPGAATCAAAGDPVLTARVRLSDPNPAAPVAGQRQVSVQSWSTRQ